MKGKYPKPHSTIHRSKKHKNKHNSHRKHKHSSRISKNDAIKFSQPIVKKPGYSNKFFVGGIHAEVTEEVLRDYFSQFGRITKVELIKNKRTGVSKGYAFITCASDLIVKKIKDFDTHVLYDRCMDIGKAADKSESKQLKDEIKKRKIFISQIGDEVTNSDLEMAFSRFGPVNKAYSILVPKTDMKTSYGYVSFKNKESVNYALN